MNAFSCRSLLLLAGTFCTTAHAIDPSSWPGYDSESLNVVVSIPVPDKPESVTLKPLLIKPTVPPPWKTVVMPSNCTGLEDRLWRAWVPSLSKANIAVVLLDSLTPRGVSDICAQVQITVATRLQDAHQVLDALRTDPRFDSRHIAIVGHSVGAQTALFSAYAATAKHLGRAVDEGFNAFVGASASCEGTHRDTTLVGPLLLISGSKDDYTRPEPCQKEITRLSSAKQTAEISLIEGVNHAFSAHGKYVPTLLHAPSDLPTVYMHKFSYLPRETEIEFEDGQVMSIEKAWRKYAGFLGSKVYGANAGGIYEKVPEVVQLTVNFLKKYGW